MTTPRTPEQRERKRLYMLEWKRRQRLLFPGKCREETNKWRAKNPDKVRAYNLSYLANVSEERKRELTAYYRERSARYFRENKEHAAEQKKEYRKRNPEKVREWTRRSEARKRLRKEPKVGSQPVAKSATEAKSMLLLQNKAFAAANEYVPRHLPHDMRDDIISDVVVACLELEICIEDVKKSIPKFITAHNKAAGYNVSLDAEIGDGMRLIDIITEENLPW